MAEPEENTYVVTFILRGVKKAQAVEFGQSGIEEAHSSLHTDAYVFVAHLKDES